jgi:hypothetical protein
MEQLPVCRRKRSQLQTAGFRPLGPLIGLNPAEMSPNPPVSGDRPATWIAGICRGYGPNQPRRGSFSHARGRRFETTRAHQAKHQRRAPRRSLLSWTTTTRPCSDARDARLALGESSDAIKGIGHACTCRGARMQALRLPVRFGQRRLWVGVELRRHLLARGGSEAVPGLAG